MGAITAEQTEWAVIDRLRQMLAAPQGDFTTTQSFALFSSIVCWVMQHVRVPIEYQRSETDRAAGDLLAQLEKEDLVCEPWKLLIDADGRIGRNGVQVPPPEGFEGHSVARLLKNLRDAMAHGDARTVRPFNHDRLLVGFTFYCAEFERRQITWNGKLVLLESDMQRIGCTLASRYCEIIKAARQSGEMDFEYAAASLKEAAA